MSIPLIITSDSVIAAAHIGKAADDQSAGIDFSKDV